MYRKLREAVILAILLAPLHAHALEIASSIATINSASTDGTPSASVFELSVQSSVLPTRLTTTTAFSLTLDLRPQASSLARSSSVYTVIVANNQFFKLEPDGRYAPWDGAVETLTPFVTGQLLSSTQTLTLLNGTMAEAGDYLYYVAYSVEGETTLHFTPEPAQISVKASTELPDNSDSQAAITFGTEIETSVVQARCVACHVEGGLARNSALQFQRSNTASALNNFGALSAFINDKGSDLLLAKIAGEKGHAGGTQLTKASTGYASIQRFIDEITAPSDNVMYEFSAANNNASPRQHAFLEGVVLETRLATLRRATLLLQERLPREEEKASITSDEDLRVALRGLMEGPAFKEFVVTSVNDRLLTKGAPTPLDINSRNYIKIYSQKVAYELNGMEDKASALRKEMSEYLYRTSGELVAHVIANEKPYSEILTADYMMMNPFLNEWLEGTAIFTDKNDNSSYEPSRIKGYYFYNSLETIRGVNSRSSWEIIGPPLDDFPHTGLLSDFAFLKRYPTTATNRNRARARWVFYHFLDIDIEKSSQRPTDDAALTDQDNPTMNNPNCTVCHAILDPVAGAFKYWDHNSRYKPNGNESLDRFYKKPENGKKSLFQRGDVWYRDMHKPGLFDVEILDQDRTLKSLAELIVAEPAFLTASAKFWWPSVFGKDLIDKPASKSDRGYADKYAAYIAQQEAISGFAKTLSENLNGKDMLVEMFMSPWFAGETANSSTFQKARYEVQFGSKQLLNPEQLYNKTRALTGVSWRTRKTISGILRSRYDRFGVLLGGIDSTGVTKRATELTPTMATILRTHASEVACPAVVREFASPTTEASLFQHVDETTTPLHLAASGYTLRSERKSDLETISLSANLSHGPKTFSLRFENPYCSYDGSICVEQRVLFLKLFRLSASDGSSVSISASDPRIRLIGDCKIDYQGDVRFSGYCTAEIDLTLPQQDNYQIEAVVSAQLAPIEGGYVDANLSIRDDVDILEASNTNVISIKNQISDLFLTLHGTNHAPDSDAVLLVYEIFAAALSSQNRKRGNTFWDCAINNDGMLYDDLLTEEQLASFRYQKAPDDNYWSEDSDKRRRFDIAFVTDVLGTKYAWTAVMMYMLSHYDYVHE